MIESIPYHKGKGITYKKYVSSISKEDKEKFINENLKTLRDWVKSLPDNSQNQSPNLRVEPLTAINNLR